MKQETIQLIEQEIEVLYQHSLTIAVIVAATLFYIVRAIQSQLGGVKAHRVGFRSAFEPTFLVRLRYSKQASLMIKDGYSKFKNSMFKVLDILVISNKYVDELRALPDEKLSAMSSLVKTALGQYSAMTILLESDLHTKVLQTQMTPNPESLVKLIKSELDFALSTEVPKCDDEWVEVQIYEILLRIIARIWARVFIGDPACRNEEWLQISIKYPENVFTTAVILRMLPSYFHPLVAPFLPSVWRVQSNLRTAKKILVPMITQRREAAASGNVGYRKPNDLLQWMIDAADKNDGRPYKLAHRQLVLTVASIHTTTMCTAHCLYDMCYRQEYFEPIREEAVQILREDDTWKKSTLNKMRKLDSLLKESQRINPPLLLGFGRVVRKPITLSDGIKLPVGTNFCVATDCVMHDADHLDNPTEYDGFRYYNKRLEEGQSSNHQFAMTDRNNLHFGHGKLACPGRFFASNEIKMILVHLLLNFDFKYPVGQTRPANICVGEFVWPDPSARLLMRRRADHNTPTCAKA